MIITECKESVMSRDLYFDDYVTLQSSMNIIKNIENIQRSDNMIRTLSKIDNMDYLPDPINLTISSYGGHIYGAMSLFDIIKNSKTVVNTRALGMSASAGFIIFLAGNYRTCTKHTTFLLHDGSCLAIGKEKEIEITLDELKRVNDLMFDIILENTKIKKEFLKEMKDKGKDVFIDARKALKLGIIHEIV